MMFGKSSGAGDMMGQAIKERRLNMGSFAAPGMGLGKGSSLGSRVMEQEQGGYAMGQAVPTSIAIRRRRNMTGARIGGALFGRNF